jgi:hypothetical protein
LNGNTDKEVNPTRDQQDRTSTETLRSKKHIHGLKDLKPGLVTIPEDSVIEFQIYLITEELQIGGTKFFQIGTEFGD